MASTLELNPGAEFWISEGGFGLPHDMTLYLLHCFINF